jgi:hypothetical protein
MSILWIREKYFVLRKVYEKVTGCLNFETFIYRYPYLVLDESSSHLHSLFI